MVSQNGPINELNSIYGSTGTRKRMIGQVVEGLPNCSFLCFRRFVDTVRLAGLPVLTDHPFEDGRPY